MSEPSAARRVLWLTGVGHAASHAWELIFPAVAIPMARDLGLSFADVVPWSFGMYLLFGLGAPLSGWLTDHLGARRVLLGGIVLGGLAGIAVTFAERVWALQVSLAALGLAASFYHPAGLALLSTHFTKVGRAFAINGIAGTVGISLTPFLSGLMASLFGWRSAFLLLSLPALAAGFVLWALPFEDRISPRRTAEAAEEEVSFLRLGFFAVALVAGGLAYRLHTLVVPALLEERGGALVAWAEGARVFAFGNADNLAATLLTTVAYSAAAGGQWWAGQLADRRPLGPTYLLFHLAAAPLVGLAAFVAGIPLFGILFAYLFLAIGMQPLENGLVARYTPARWRGRAYAGKFILTFGLGSLGTFLVKALVPSFGLGGPLAAASALELTLVLAMSLVLWRDRRAVRVEVSR